MIGRYLAWHARLVASELAQAYLEEKSTELFLLQVEHLEDIHHRKPHFLKLGLLLLELNDGAVGYQVRTVNFHRQQGHALLGFLLRFSHGCQPE